MSPKTRSRVRSIGDLAVLAPYLLGFQPTRSVVIFALRSNELVLTQRLDLVPDEAEARAAARQMAGFAAREGADQVSVICFEDESGQSRPMRLGLYAAALSVGLGPVMCAVVREGRWYDPEETVGGCAADGTPLPDADSVPAVADFVARGRSPLPSREAIREQLRPGAGPRCEDVEDAVVAAELVAGSAGRRRPVAVWSMAWRSMLHVEPGRAAIPGPDCVAQLVVSLQDISWRDALVCVLCPTDRELDRFAALPLAEALEAVAGCPWAMQPGCLDSCTAGCPCGGPVVHETTGRAESDVAVVLARLCGLVRQVPADRAVPLLTLVATLAWWAGEGSMASIALEEALRIDPDYRLAALLDTMVAHGLRLPTLAA